jgi:hypothetical protein
VYNIAEIVVDAEVWADSFSADKINEESVLGPNMNRMLRPVISLAPNSNISSRLVSHCKILFVPLSTVSLH